MAKKEKSIPFKDTDIMFFGAHKGTALINVPATYLLWWYEKNRENYTSLGGDYRRLYLYIEDVIDILKKENSQQETFKKPKK